MKRIRLTENDLVSMVKKLMIKEQEEQRMQIDFSGVFPSGQFDPKFINGQELQQKINVIYDFIQRYPNNNISVTITGGESQVPNPEEFKEKGSLAKKRCQTIINKMKEILTGRVDLNKVNFSIAHPVIGSTTYKKSSSDPNNQAYTNEQFIKVLVSVTGVGETNNTPSWCNAKDEGSGKVGNRANGFVAEYKRYDLKGDVGNIVLKFDPIVVPDMSVLKYDNKIYNTGFIGNGSIQYEVTIATILATTYKGVEMPAHFSGIQLTAIDQATWTVFERSMHDHQTYSNFIDDIAPIMTVDINQFPTWRRFRGSNFFKELNWSIMAPLINRGNPNMTMESGYHVLRLPKTKANTLELWVISICGTSRWSIRFACEGSSSENPQT